SGAARGGLPAAVGREGHDDVGPSLCRVAGDLPAGGLPRTRQPRGMVGSSFGRGRRGVPGAGGERQTCADDAESQERTACHGVLLLVLHVGPNREPPPWEVTGPTPGNGTFVSERTGGIFGRRRDPWRHTRWARRRFCCGPRTTLQSRRPSCPRARSWRTAVPGSRCATTSSPATRWPGTRWPRELPFAATAT